jgi:hypothetical protein
MEIFEFGRAVVGIHSGVSVRCKSAKEYGDSTEDTLGGVFWANCSSLDFV